MTAAWVILTVTSVLFAAREVSSHNDECSNGWTSWKRNTELGYEYKMICWKDYVSEDVALKRCREERADLASIHSKDENDFVTDVAYGVGMSFKSGLKVWIGLHKNKHGGWEWSDGTAYDYKNWDDKQPDNYNGHETESPEDCTQIYSSGKWNDLKCNGLVRKCVCKREWIPLEMEKFK